MTKPRFIHLHVHSDYSIVDGLAKVHKIVKKVADLKMPSVAITDFSNLFGLVKFYNYAHKIGIKPIIGVDVLVRNEKFLVDNSYLTILAANNLGYQNLIYLISKAYRNVRYFYGSSITPIIDRTWLVDHNNGLILLSGGCKGDIGKCLLRKNFSQLEECLLFYESYFPERYYLELIRTGRQKEEEYLHAAVELAEKKGLPVVASNDVRFIKQSDFNAHEIRVAIHAGFTIDDIKRPNNYSPQQFLRSEQEMVKLFSEFPEALENSVEIACRCNVTLKSGEYFLPKFSTGAMSPEDFLTMRSLDGMDKRLVLLFPNVEERLVKRPLYNKRLNNELQVINKMGFSSYFLIVMEFIQWAKDNNIPVGPGRGSGAGSLVAYALKITDIDPISFDLLFERFLNPYRISMPDFDIDFCMEKRDLVIDHVMEIYGRDAVSQIITFGTMTAKSVIRDVGRVLGYPYGFINHLSKLIPFDPEMTLEKSLLIEPELLKLYNSNEEVKALMCIAQQLEGVIRHAGKHAGGVVIAPTKITDFSPLYCDSKGKNFITQFDKDDIEYVGLVKFDFLGLRTLTIIHNTIEMINFYRSQYGLSHIDINTIPLDDSKSFEILKKAETTSVFQLESLGMKDLIKRLQPDCFEDIIALIALFRPGPLQSGMVDNFINRKHGHEPISYPDIQWQHHLLASILESTYGIILYQEQVMQIAQTLAGYTLSDADMLRLAMGKKKPEDMSKHRNIFKSGAEKRGIDGKLAIKIFNLLEKFSGYGFNKSHSAAYALVSYQTLWLKTHYPSEFMAAVMTTEMDNTEKIVGLMDECCRIGIKVLPPDINSSKYNFHVNSKGEIVYGLGAIKGIGESSIEEIINVRSKEGKFKNLFDLCIRSNRKKLNGRVIKTLISSGALDCFGSNRLQLISSLQKIIKISDQYAHSKSIKQKDMFNIFYENDISKFMKGYNVHTQLFSEKNLLEGEKKTLGIYLSGHPIYRYLQEILYYSNGIRLRDIPNINTTSCGMISVCGLLLSSKVIITKGGNRIGKCIIDDHSGRLDVVLFTDTFEKYKKFLENDTIIIVQGTIHFDNQKKIKMTAKSIMDINEARKKYVRGIAITLRTMNDKKILNQILLSLESYRFGGNTPVHIYIKRKLGERSVLERLYFLESKLKVNITDHLLDNLKELIGSEQVTLEF